jgi:hypothetical protein
MKLINFVLVKSLLCKRQDFVQLFLSCAFYGLDTEPEPESEPEPEP